MPSQLYGQQCQDVAPAAGPELERPERIGFVVIIVIRIGIGKVQVCVVLIHVHGRYDKPVRYIER